MRADRLITILLMLQQRGRMSAAAIAREVEVSRRTVMRDLEALGAAGVPIYAVRGPNGGYQLWEGFRAQLTGLTAEEVRALPLWSVPYAARVFRLGDALNRARMKVALSLPASMKDDLARIDQVFLLDPVPLESEGAPADTLEFLASAIERRRVLRAVLVAGDRVEIYPLGLIDNAGSWLLVGDVEGHRTVLPVSELGDLATTGRRFHRPDDFDLAVTWRAWRRDRHGQGRG